MRNRPVASAGAGFPIERRVGELVVLLNGLLGVEAVNRMRTNGRARPKLARSF
jgi:hypothetical protein